MTPLQPTHNRNRDFSTLVKTKPRPADERNVWLNPAPRKDCEVPSSPLRIALLEPNPAYAAELGQLLSEILRDFSFELSVEKTTADIVLMDEVAPLPQEQRQNPTILFGRSKQGGYTAHGLRGGGHRGIASWR